MAELEGLMNTILNQAMATQRRQERREYQSKQRDRRIARSKYNQRLKQLLNSFSQQSIAKNELFKKLNKLEDQAKDEFGPVSKKQISALNDQIRSRVKRIARSRDKLKEHSRRINELKRDIATTGDKTKYKKLMKKLGNLQKKDKELIGAHQQALQEDINNVRTTLAKKKYKQKNSKRILNDIKKDIGENSEITETLQRLHNQGRFDEVLNMASGQEATNLQKYAQATNRAKNREGELDPLERQIANKYKPEILSSNKIGDVNIQKKVNQEIKNILGVGENNSGGYNQAYNFFQDNPNQRLQRELKGTMSEEDIFGELEETSVDEVIEGIRGRLVNPSDVLNAGNQRTARVKELSEGWKSASAEFINSIVRNPRLEDKFLKSDLTDAAKTEMLVASEGGYNSLKNDNNKLSESGKKAAKKLMNNTENISNIKQAKERMRKASSKRNTQLYKNALQGVKSFINQNDSDFFKDRVGNARQTYLSEAADQLITGGNKVSQMEKRLNAEGQDITVRGLGEDFSKSEENKPPIPSGLEEATESPERYDASSLFGEIVKSPSREEQNIRTPGGHTDTFSPQEYKNKVIAEATPNSNRVGAQIANRLGGLFNKLLGGSSDRQTIRDDSVPQRLQGIFDELERME